MQDGFYLGKQNSHQILPLCLQYSVLGEFMGSPNLCIEYYSRVINIKAESNMVIAQRNHWKSLSTAPFQLLGTVLLVIAIWSKTEKGNLMDFNSMAIDPATILLIVGAIMFWIGFFGWVGALRENVKFLQVVSLFAAKLHYTWN